MVKSCLQRRTKLARKTVIHHVPATTWKPVCFFFLFHQKTQIQIAQLLTNVTAVGGGNGVFEVFSTGTTLNEPIHFEPEEKEEEESKDAAPSVVTEVITPTPAADVAQSDIPDVQEDSDDEGSAGVSTAAIAAGSVAGVLGISSLVGGVFLFLRHRKRREAEEAYKNAVSVNSFIEDGKRPPYSSGSGSDSRLDPVAAQRRMSDGSIADNEDYSRRILQVCCYLGYTVDLVMLIRLNR